MRALTLLAVLVTAPVAAAEPIKFQAKTLQDAQRQWWWHTADQKRMQVYGAPHFKVVWAAREAWEKEKSQLIVEGRFAELERRRKEAREKIDKAIERVESWKNLDTQRIK